MIHVVCSGENSGQEIQIQRRINAVVCYFLITRVRRRCETTLPRNSDSARSLRSFAGNATMTLREESLERDDPESKSKQFWLRFFCTTFFLSKISNHISFVSRVII